MHLISAINTDKSLKVTCSAMFKQLFSREVLTSMTAQKKNKIKLLFKETKFFACLKGKFTITDFIYFLNTESKDIFLKID